MGLPTTGFMAERVRIALRQRTGAGKAAIGHFVWLAVEAAVLAGRE